MIFRVTLINKISRYTSCHLSLCNPSIDRFRRADEIWRALINKWDIDPGSIRVRSNGNDNFTGFLIVDGEYSSIFNIQKIRY